MKNCNYSILGIKAETPIFWGRVNKILDDNSVELIDGKIIKPKDGDTISDNGQTKIYSLICNE